MYRFKQIFTTLIMMMFIVIMISTQTASAYTSSDGITAPETLSINVGYYGGPYTTKVTISRLELERMPQYEGYYTYITGVGTTMLQYAKGPTLKTIMKYAGIDMNSVQQFHFICEDNKGEWFVSKSRTDLINVTRHYYPNLRSNGYRDKETEKWIVTNETAAKEGAVVVPTILAIKQVTTKDPTKTVYPSQMTRDDSFRLCFGQKDFSTITSRASAKWVYGIDVQLSGTPPKDITIKEGTEIKTLVGSKNNKLTYSLLGDDISADAKQITWKSSDKSVVKVDSLGRITPLKSGTATITAITVNGKKASIVIKVYKDKIPPDETKDKNKPIISIVGSKDNAGNSSGSGKGHGGTKGLSSNKNSVKGNYKSSKGKKIKIDSKSGKTKNLTGFKEIKMPSGTSISLKKDDEVQNWRSKNMNKDAKELPGIDGGGSGGIYAGSVATCAFGIGIIIGLRKFFTEV